MTHNLTRDKPPFFEPQTTNGQPLTLYLSDFRHTFTLLSNCIKPFILVIFLTRASLKYFFGLIVHQLMVTNIVLELATTGSFLGLRVYKLRATKIVSRLCKIMFSELDY